MKFVQILVVSKRFPSQIGRVDVFGTLACFMVNIWRSSDPALVCSRPFEVKTTLEIPNEFDRVHTMPSA